MNNSVSRGTQSYKHNKGFKFIDPLLNKHNYYRKCFQPNRLLKTQKSVPESPESDFNNVTHDSIYIPFYLCTYLLNQWWNTTCDTQYLSILTNHSKELFLRYIYITSYTYVKVYEHYSYSKITHT